MNTLYAYAAKHFHDRGELEKVTEMLEKIEGSPNEQARAYLELAEAL